jgi:hypothetical protein
MFQPKGLEFWMKKELALLSRRHEIERTIAAAESTAAVAMLDDDDPSGTNAAATIAGFDRANAEIRALNGAIAGCRTRRLDAIRAQRAQGVEKIRRDAADKMQQMRSVDSRAQKLLAQISELEECDYLPKATPRSGRLRAEAEALERQAQDVEAQGVPDSGMIDLEAATTSEEVVVAALQFPADGPPAEKLFAWLESCERAAVQRCGSGFGDRPRRVRIEWDADGIKPSSYVLCIALARKQPRQPGDETDSYDIPSGTFTGEAV